MPAAVVVEGILTVVRPSKGIVKSLLLVDPLSPLNGEHITSSLRESRGELGDGKLYRVTYEEIPCLSAPSS